jgi:hypothetical protein
MRPVYYSESPSISTGDVILDGDAIQKALKSHPRPFRLQRLEGWCGF